MWRRVSTWMKSIFQCHWHKKLQISWICKIYWDGNSAIDMVFRWGSQLFALLNEIIVVLRAKKWQGCVWHLCENGVLYLFVGVKYSWKHLSGYCTEFTALIFFFLSFTFSFKFIPAIQGSLLVSVSTLTFWHSLYKRHSVTAVLVGYVFSNNLQLTSKSIQTKGVHAEIGICCTV